VAMVSFVVPCYNEQDNVLPFYEACSSAFAADDAAEPWRLVMVDDGSSDATFERLSQLAAQDARVTVLSFSRNFGKEAAVYAGLNEARDSDYVCIIDADLQQLPSTALDMLRVLREHDDLDCVAAYQESRREGLLMGWAKRSFYKVFTRAARSQSVIENASDFRVFRREVTEALLSLTEYHRFSKGLFSWVGFKTYAYPYVPEERNSGSSKWSLRSLVRYAMEGILSFSTRPLHLVTVMGVCASFIALLYALVLIIKTLIVGIDVPGYASTTALVLIFGGLILLSLGIIGEYLARLYVQEKHRPVYIVRRTLNGSQTMPRA